jgi:rhodanese-related sulfurtransferase
MRVNDDANHPTATGWIPETRKVVIETVLVILAGAALALAANVVSPRGLALRRNYFPPGIEGASRTAILPPPASGPPTNEVAVPQRRAAQIREMGLQSIDHDQAVRRFGDPRFAQEKVIFIDARDEEHYRAGHVPGAFEFDPYRPERHLAAVLPVCQLADEVVLYCNGGECEDSLFAAIVLREAGLPGERLFVYEGGFSEWTTNGLPVETGERNSGILRQATK